MFGRLKGLARQSLIYTAGDVLNRAFAFLLIPLYTAYLTPTDYGILAITSTIGSILSILYLQPLESALTRFHYDFSDDRGRRECYGTIWLLMVGFSLLASLLIESFGQPVSGWLFEDVPYAPYVRLVVWLTFLSNSSFLLYRAVLRVQERPVAFVTLNIGTFLVNTALIAYLVVAKGRGALGSLEGRFLASLILAIPVAIAFLRNASLRWSWPRAKASLKFSVPLMPHLLSLWVLSLSDRLILQKYLPLSDVGIYNLGYQMASIVQVLAFSAMNAWSPFFYRTANEPGASRMLSRFSTYYWLAVAILCTGVATLARDVLVVMASRPAYYVAYRVVPWVVLASMMRAFYFVFITALYHTKKVKSVPLVTVVSGLINVGLNLLLVPRYGYMVAAITTFAAYALQAVVMYYLAQRVYPMPYERARVAKLLTVGLGLYAASTVLPLSPGWTGLAVKMGVALTYPIWLTLLGFWTPDEMATFRRLAHRAATCVQGH
jgi:O-antigen/teichoic acid export membrane protein